MSSLLEPFFNPLKQLIGLAARSRPGRAAMGITPNSISDDRFRDQLWQIRNLKLFLFQENVAFKEEDLPKIGLEGLDAIQYSIYGRSPTAAEWNLLDAKQSALSSYLDGRLRWKLRLSHMRKYYTTIPVMFLLISVIALAGGIVQHIFSEELTSIA